MSIEEHVTNIMNKTKCTWEEAYKKAKETKKLKQFF